MAIEFDCKCGKHLKARPEAAGKRTKCPFCGAVVAIPGGAPVKAGVVSSIGEPDAIAVNLDWSGTDAPPVATEPEAPSSLIKVDSLSPTAPDQITGDEGDDRPGDGGGRQYKILTPKDYGIPGKFNPGKLEETLNQLAGRGWTVKSSVVINVVGHAGAHDELVVILER